MTERDVRTVARLLKGRGREPGGIDELQGLLLQISLAIMMIFIIAFFVFRSKAEDEVMKLNRQKLVMAADRVERDYRERYGLAVLMGEGAGGERTFDSAAVIRNGVLTDVETARAAFAGGARFAAADYADAAALRADWRKRIVSAAGLVEADLLPEDRRWLTDRLEAGTASVRADVHGLQRACAAAIQRAWLARPTDIPDGELKSLVLKLRGASDEERLRLAAEISSALRARSLIRLAEMAGADLLP